MSSTQGCWTCRLRRKKCSAEYPICSRCGQLNITCSGYAAKPLWMDGGQLEKEGLEKLKKAVKLTTDGQRRSRALRGRAKTAQEQKSYRSEQVESLKEQGEPKSDADLVLITREPSVVSSKASNGAASDEHPTFLWSHKPLLESFLLMHYLDFVFPLQFPFYSPDAQQGGRGWYLGLLMRSKPLYNAALTLAAYYHHKTSPCQAFNATCDGFERFHSLALNGLSEHIGKLRKKGLREGLKDGIEALACVVQLILFDVARGGYQDWQPHLRAAPDLHPFLKTYCTHPLMRISHSSEDHFPDVEDLSFADHAAMEFFSSVILHLDVLACASTGQGPQYANICAAALGDRDSKVRLDKIMGCENWVVILIREIAVLRDSGQVENPETFDVSAFELRTKLNSIESRLNAGLWRLTESRSPKDGKIVKQSELIVGIITEAYAHAAKLYVNVLIEGPRPELPEIRESVSSTLATFAKLPDPKYIRFAIWPYCIAGCMAQADQRQAYRELGSAAGITPGVFGSSYKALEVMETCWRLRDEGKIVDWLAAMDFLGCRVLLV